MRYTQLFLFLLPLYTLAQVGDQVFNCTLSSLAFGSCNKETLADRQLWKEVRDQNPDLWLWLGDNIYGDSEDDSVLNAKYDLQKSHPDYQALISHAQVLGIWDDHDYGVNDGGKEFPAKDQSKDALFDFLDVADDHPARGRAGAYQSYTFQGDKNVKVILLDARYFRDSLLWDRPPGGLKVAQINATGDILGEEQWQWLTQQLRDSSIDLYLVASGIQFIPDQHQWEKWSNFPLAKTRLMTLLSTTPKPIVLLSGDRHISEISQTQSGEANYPLIEFTSSSLTLPIGRKIPDSNRFRVKDVVFDPNFAVMNLSWERKKLSIQVKYIGAKNVELQSHEITYDLVK